MDSANFHHHQQQDHHHHLMDSTSFSCSSNPILNSSHNTSTDSIVQDVRFPYNGMGYPVMTHDLQHLARIKDEFSVVESYPKFLELLNCNSISSIQDLEDFYNSTYLKINDHDHRQISYTSNNNQDLTFSQIFPTISISSLNQSTTTTSSSSSTSSSSISPTSFDMNCLPALDPFGSPSFDRKFSPHSSLSAHNLGAISYGFDHMHQQNHRPSVYPNKVRKEKLGDRIAAIQQLVAPFGKTDTASVLMEAIGYIKFLQTQVETLSVPYMKSTNESGGISSQVGRQMEEGSTWPKRDLRSRGLCLVPVSCLSYVTDGCEGIWPAP